MFYTSERRRPHHRAAGVRRLIEAPRAAQSWTAASANWVWIHRAASTERPVGQTSRRTVAAETVVATYGTESIDELYHELLDDSINAGQVDLAVLVEACPQDTAR